jgi:hypothetical protein
MVYCGGMQAHRGLVWREFALEQQVTYFRVSSGGILERCQCRGSTIGFANDRSDGILSKWPRDNYTTSVCWNIQL